MKTYGKDPHPSASLTVEKLEAFEKTHHRMMKKILPQALQALEFKAANASEYTLEEENLSLFRLCKNVTSISFLGIADSMVNVSVKFNESVSCTYKVHFSELTDDNWKEDYCAKEALLKAKEARENRITKEKKAI